MPYTKVVMRSNDLVSIRFVRILGMISWFSGMAYGAALLILIAFPPPPASRRLALIGTLIPA